MSKTYYRMAPNFNWLGEVIPTHDKARIAECHLTDSVDRQLARLIGRSMQIPGRHGFEVLFREFMQRGYEAARRLPKGGR